MVKKLLLSLAIMLGVTPAFGMWSGVRHTWIKNTLNSFPEDKRAFSPAVGLLLLEGTLGKKIYDEESPRGQFARNVFHCLDGRLRQTALQGNPFYSIDAVTLGKLARAAFENKLNEFIAGDATVAWHQTHCTQSPFFSKFKDFKKALKKRLNPLEQMKLEDRAYVFSMLAVAQSQKEDDFKAYSMGLGIDVCPEQFDPSTLSKAKQMDIEEMITMLSHIKKNNYDQLVPSGQLSARYQHHQSVAICGEQSLWAFVNLVLYNKEKNYLDLSLLPATVHVLPAFKVFIEKYKNIEGTQYYSNAANEWMSLVSGIPGVKYEEADYEISTDIHTTVKIMNHLFGCNAQSIQEYEDILSTQTRTVSIEGARNDEYPSLRISVNDQHQRYNVEGLWEFSTDHAAFSLLQNNRNWIYKFVKKLVEYEDINQSIPLAQGALNYLATVFFVSKKYLEDIFGIKFEDKDIFFKTILNLPSFNINQAFVQGMHLLQRAALINNFEKVKLFVEHGADATQGISGAAGINNFEMVTYLFEHGAKIDNGDLQDTYELVKNKEIARFLMQQGADARPTLKSQLRRSTYQGDFMMKYMFDPRKGLDGKFFRNEVDFYHYKCDLGMNPVPELIYLLSREKASSNVVKVLVNRAENLNGLFKARLDKGFGNLSRIERLVNLEIDPNILLEAYLGYVPTERYAIDNEVHRKIIQTLLEGKADVDKTLNKIIEFYNNNHTDRHHSFPYYDTIKCCVEHGADSTSALAWAARTRSFSSFMGLMRATGKVAFKEPITLM